MPRWVKVVNAVWRLKRTKEPKLSSQEGAAAEDRESSAEERESSQASEHSHSWGVDEDDTQSLPSQDLSQVDPMPSIVQSEHSQPKSTRETEPTPRLSGSSDPPALAQIAQKSKGLSELDERPPQPPLDDQPSVLSPERPDPPQNKIVLTPFQHSKYPNADVRVEVAALMHHYGIAGSDNNIFVASFVVAVNEVLVADSSNGVGMNVVSPMHGLELPVSIPAVVSPMLVDTLQCFGVQKHLHLKFLRDLTPILSKSQPEPPPVDNSPDKKKRECAFIVLAFAAVCALLASAVAFAAFENEHGARWSSSGANGTSTSNDSTYLPGSSVVITTRTQRPGASTPGPSPSPSTFPAFLPSPLPSPKPTVDVEALVEQMTTSEKHAMVLGVGFKADEYGPSNGFFVGNIPAIPRLGIPSLNMQDAGQGFRTMDERMIGQVTSWACALALSCTWDTELVHSWAVAASAEFRAKGANVILGPGVNVHRVARGGRNAEYLSGEDPLLGSSLVGPWIRGFQDSGVLCIVKHFALNNQESRREFVNSILPDATAAWEVYYPPFQAAIDAGVGAVMCSYNSVNGTHSCSNNQLLNLDLKQTMGFEGFVVSDWWATTSTAVNEGLDMDMPGNFDGALAEPHFSSEKLAKINISAIDAMVTRILSSMVKVGMFENREAVCSPGVDCDTLLYDTVATSDSHKSLALNITTSSVLLLQNENSTLPLGNTTNAGSSLTIAVVGSACNASNDVDEMLPAFDEGNYYTVGGSGRVIPESVVSVVAGLRKRVRIEHQLSVTLVESLTDDIPSGLAALLKADVAITCGGGTSQEMSDRDTLLLDQNDFIVEIAKAAQIPVIVAMLCPGAVLTPFKDDAAAILAVFFGGASTGDAIASVIFGDHNPGSKSPVTFPLDEADVVAPCVPPDDYWNGFDCLYSEGLEVGYKALDGAGVAVAFPFGHGLSFTTFQYSWSESPVVLPEGGLRFDISVTNTGHVDGTEVVQVYASFPVELSMPSSSKSLKAFKKITVKHGQHERVRFELPPRSFQRWDNNQWKFVDSPGSYTVQIGSSSRDIRLSADVDL